MPEYCDDSNEFLKIAFYINNINRNQIVPIIKTRVTMPLALSDSACHFENSN